MYFRQMVKAQKKESLLHGDVEQHGQITHGEWYLRSHRRRVYDDSGIEDDNIRKEFKEVISSLSAGAVAGAVAKTTIAPLDRTKIIFQTSNKPFSVKGAVGVLRQTYLENGFLGLFRGNSATMARVIPYASLQFTAHEQFKMLLRKDRSTNGPLPPVRRFLAGSLAGITAASCTYPLDMIRARLAITQKNRYTGLANIVAKIYREEGFLAYYRGLVPTLFGIVPYAGISFFTYESLKKVYFDSVHDAKKLHPLHRLFFGACAGLLGQSATYPLEIIRRRMQTNGISGPAIPEYQRMWATAKYVVSTEGVKKGLYKGLTMNWIKGPIAVGVSFTTFDLLHGFLQKNFIEIEN
ncbi:mitochondrial coenzyme A transporter SLC25A42-like [Montipora capricornis]|uniref:mitochondrial coenzyme A transporter SLC25A42-like n=1 Tax=Montipora capricornis TaxID=246305 RepID=UPI0035F17313